MTATLNRDSTLDRYVPRLAVAWDDSAPARLWQELDASLCFVDISGFTNLSERLARRGRIGAEELTDVLNHVFGSMLEVTYRQGGSLLKFGGDALLLMFSEVDHPVRAASAAVQMRHVLREAENYETSVGKLRLRMSVGVHSGAVHLFKAGKSHSELVIAGPGASATTAMEKIADAGEIVISDGTRRALPEGAAPSGKEDGWLLRWRKERFDPAASFERQESDPDAVRQWVPLALRTYLAAGDPEAEHRICNVAFIRFSGFDETLATHGADHAAAAIDETITIVQQAADEEGVTFLATDINEDGGKVILVTGTPMAREEDEGRLLRAMRRIADTPTEFSLHFGLNQGHVFAGAIGTTYRSTYTIIGDTVNLAARLAAAAPANTVYATPGILDNSAILFDTDPVEPFHVKGKQELIHAYAVGNQVGERAEETDGELPFVGRTQEISVITEAIFETSNGHGTVLTVVGDVGSGKSRLVREACLICSAVRAISIRSESYGASTPYRPLRDVFRTLLDIDRADQEIMAKALEARIAEIDSELLPYLPFLGDVTHIEVPSTETVDAIEPRFRPDRLADAVIRVLGELLKTPTVFDVEDAQWMDDASAQLLGRIAGETEKRPWTVLVSRRGRDEGFMPETGQVLELGGLEHDDAERLVIEATAAAPLRPHDVEVVVARSGGNPLFLHEILQVVRDTGSVQQLPDSLGSVVSRSIDALPPLTRRILRYCSVLGRSFRTSIVQEILRQDGLELDAATRRTLRRFLVADGKGRLRFSNAMVRDVAYDGLSFKRRRELHLRAAKAIEHESESPDAAADLLSLHYSIGGDAERAWHYARIAGDQARDAYANVEAAAHYVRALESARRLDEVTDADRAGVWTQLGDVREQAGLFDSAVEAYRRAARHTEEDPVSQAELLLKRAGARERAAQYPLALRETTRARHLIEDVPSREAQVLAAGADAFYALVRIRQEKPLDALRAAQDAVKEASDAGAKAALARAYSVMAWAYLRFEDPGSEELCRKALDLYEELNDLVGQTHMHNNLGVLAYFRGNWNEALDHYEQSRTGSERLGNVVDVSFVEANMGELLVNQMRLDEAEAYLRRALQVARASGELWTATLAEVHLGRVLFERGEFEAAEKLLRKGHEEAIDLDYRSRAFESAIYLAECLIRKGEPDSGLALLEEALTRGGDEISEFAATAARVKAMGLSAVGRTDDAVRIAEEGLSLARSSTLDYEAALLLRLEADLVEPDDQELAERYRNESTAIADRLGVLSNVLVGENT